MTNAPARQGLKNVRFWENQDLLPKTAPLLVTPCLKILSRFHRLIATLRNEI